MVGHLVAALAGLAVMAAPSLFGYSGTAADIDHVVGPVAASVGIIAASQVLRAFRWLNIPLGLILLTSMPFLSRSAFGTILIGVAGATLVATAFVRGRMDVKFGGGWSSLWRADQSSGRS